MGTLRGICTLKGRSTTVILGQDCNCSNEKVDGLPKQLNSVDHGVFRVAINFCKKIVAK